MQTQDFFIKCNDWRPFRNQVLNKITGNCSKAIIKAFANIIVPFVFRLKPGVKIYRKREKYGHVSDAVVSMTSFPARISYVWLVIECLLRQTRVPNKIVVYLSEDQFKGLESLPLKLRQYPKDIVEIHFVNGDIRSHKKYWYAVEEWKDQPLILVDDDIIYDSRMVEDLETYSSEKEKTIACCWGTTINWDEHGNLNPYSQWKGKCRKKIGVRDNSRFFGSGGGTFFPVGSLKDANHDINIIMDICPSADDIWLNAITRKNGYRALLIRDNVSVPEWSINNNNKLSTINNQGKQNDIQLFAVQKYFINTFGMDPFSNN